MKEPVHLICACDSAFNMPLCVMLTSVADHFDPDRELVVHVISNDSTAHDRENVRTSIAGVRKGTAIDVHWYALDAATLAKLPPLEDSRFSRDTFARILAPHLLPETCERALYLDCDMVVLTDVAQLYDSTAGAASVLHAAHDVGCPWVSWDGGVFDYVERGIPPQAPCFNAGVLVIDLKRWRERALTASLLAYIEQYGERIHWADQGAMNAFLYDDWIRLDLRWNQPPHVLREDMRVSRGYSKEEWRRTRHDPYIVHYMGPHKPWHPVMLHTPRRAYFFRYLQKTVYRDTVGHFPYLESVLGFDAYYQLWSLGFKLFPNGIRRRPPERARTFWNKTNPKETTT